MVANAHKTYKRKQNRKYLKSNFLVQLKTDYHHTYKIEFVIIIIFLH